jgi:hypothetical protein
MGRFTPPPGCLKMRPMGFARLKPRAWLWIQAGAKAITLGLLTACGVSTGSDDAEQSISLLTVADIQTAKAVWATRRAGRGYVIEYQRQCFCSPLPAGYRVVQNTFGQKILVEYLDINGAVYDRKTPPQNLTSYFSVEDFFTAMETQWILTGFLAGRLDPEWGIPTELSTANFTPLISPDTTGFRIQLVQTL